MNERLPNPIVDVERELSCAIASIGGVRVDQIIGKVQEKNADFLFDQYSVIAELKVLTKDQINDPEFVKKSSAMYKKYLSVGQAPVCVQGTVRLTTEGFPEEFTREIANLYSAPIGRVIRSADRQIRSTRTILDREDHAGVLYWSTMATRH